MAKKQRKRKPGGTGQKNQARFQQFMLAQAQKTPAGIKQMNNGLLMQFPWIGFLDPEDQEDCLSDFRVALEQETAGDSGALLRTAEVWEPVAVREKENREKNQTS